MLQLFLTEVVGVSDNEKEKTLGGLLQLWTGRPSLPMLEGKLTVAFLPNKSSKVLVEVDTCFKVLKIPSYHSDYNDFFFK